MQEWFHPVVENWFRQTYGAPTAAQLRAWPRIAAGEHTLLLAPTGSGKTLAAFLVAVDRLAFNERDGDASRPTSGVRVLYVSPLKALGVDVERNLQTPLAGIRDAAEEQGVAFQQPTVGVRSGDTPESERRRLTREPPDILITTPESLYLILTSAAREILRDVETVIIDEIHTMAATKRGAHLFLSLERLERLRRESNSTRPAAQRIGLSATQRPLDEIATLLGGAEAPANSMESVQVRPVTVVEAGRRKQLDLRVEVPVEDMAALLESNQALQRKKGNRDSRPAIPSIWPAIYPRLVELIQTSRSTMIFVNNRRLAERMANAINEQAGEELALAHHGSVAKDARQHIEGLLKRGELPAIVATSSLELGIDMGAVDLVILIESPPSIASGLQRVGRAGHRADLTARGVIFPKFRGDLLACSAATGRMLAGEVEETFYPRNPLDVLSQQVAAIVAEGRIRVEEVFAIVRGAAPFADLPWTSFEGVLDLLSGRYPSNEFSGLRPRLNWDRRANQLEPRRGTQRVAILNAGTIPDRGLYGVFLVGDDDQPGSRVGELDEEMVFETKPGDVFVLGASSWRVLEITHDRVLVAPAPGEPGAMPFWKGDGPGRPMEFGEAIGRLADDVLQKPRERALADLESENRLDSQAADNLLQYLADQQEATRAVPSDRCIVVERFPDEMGDWRIAVLSPFGSRVHAPWATAVRGRLREKSSGEVDVSWTDDGIVFRLPECDEYPTTADLFPVPDGIEDKVVRELASTSLFAARFRENAGRALLLPRRGPDKRTPLWIQRKRSADLLKAASRYPAFPIMLETYRECLRDVFDLPGLQRLLTSVKSGDVRVVHVETPAPSPFAASLMLNHTASFLYDDDAPLAERRAQALSLDFNQLRELLGNANLRALLDADVVIEVEQSLQRLAKPVPLRDADELHDLLRELGDLTRDEIQSRAGADGNDVEAQLDSLVDSLRACRIVVANEERFVTAEEAAVWRDGVGVDLPPGLPDVFLEPVDDPLGNLVLRYAATHGPFTPDDVAIRLGIETERVKSALRQLSARDLVIEGEFRPGGDRPEWCHVDVLRQLKQRSLDVLRKQIQPVDDATFTQFLFDWNGVGSQQPCDEAMVDVIAQLQGLPLPVSALHQILGARVDQYSPRALDELCATGEVLWRGCGTLGPKDARIAFYLRDSFAELAPVPDPVDDPVAERIRELLSNGGALFLDSIKAAIGGFSHDLTDALWRLVWAGIVTNDSPRVVADWRRSKEPSGRHAGRSIPRRARYGLRQQPRGDLVVGSRWSLLDYSQHERVSPTERLVAIASQLIDRYGIVCRESLQAESVPGGFAGLYPLLRSSEESGLLRRGYFVDGLGASQFAAPAAEESLRELKNRRRVAVPRVAPPVDDNAEPVHEILSLSAVDPANPFGAALSWPTISNNAQMPKRDAGAQVFFIDHAPVAWLNQTSESLTIFWPEDGSLREPVLQQAISAMIHVARQSGGINLKRIDGIPGSASPHAEAFGNRGFQITQAGLIHRKYA